MTTTVFLKGNVLTDSAGHPVMESPSITMNTKTELVVTQLNNAAAAGEITSWEFTLNREFNAPETAKLRISRGITTDSGGAVHVDLGSAVSQELLQAMGHAPSGKMFGELAGFSAGNSAPVRCMQFPVTVLNRVGGGSFTPAAVSGALTEAQVRALLADETFVQQQADWDQTDTSKADYIKNKPSVPGTLADLSGDGTHRVVTDAEKEAWDGKLDEPSGGSAGQYLRKTASGTEWSTVAVPEICVGACSSLGQVTGTSSITLSWADPDDVILNGAVIAKWVRTVLVRKLNGYPSAWNDGTAVAFTDREAGSKNGFRDVGYTDSPQVTGTCFYGLFSLADSGAWNSLAENLYPQGMSSYSWYNIRQFVRAGTAPQLWPVGTVFCVDHPEYTHQDGTGIAFRVSGYDQVPAQDESLTHTMCLEMAECLFTAPCDYCETDYALTEDTAAQGGKDYYVRPGSAYVKLIIGTDYNVGDPVPVASWYEKNLDTRSHGGNNPVQSNQIQWANSSDAAGSWFQKQNLWDVCSTALQGKNGFCKYIDSSFLDVVKPAKLVTARCTAEGGGSVVHYARFWSLSSTQIYGSANNGVLENVQLSFYSAGGEKRKTLKDSASFTAWYLRSPGVGDARSVQTVNTSGSLGSTFAWTAAGVSLACIIA